VRIARLPTQRFVVHCALGRASSRAQDTIRDAQASFGAARDAEPTWFKAQHKFALINAEVLTACLPFAHLHSCLTLLCH